MRTILRAWRSGTLAIVTCVLLAPPLGAQGATPLAPGPAGRLVVMRPRPGEAAEFEAGYRRHLEWHRAHADPWTWYGWSVVLGDAPGMFVDGTFGHAWTNLDRPVDPAGDAADNAANVLAHADLLSHEAIVRLDDASTDGALPDSAPFLELVRHRVAIGRTTEFEALLRRMRARAARGERYAWYRVVAGGGVGEYLLLRPRASFGAVGASTEFFAGAPAGQASGLVLDARSWLLRARRELSYTPAR